MHARETCANGRLPRMRGAARERAILRAAALVHAVCCTGARRLRRWCTLSVAILRARHCTRGCPTHRHSRRSLCRSPSTRLHSSARVRSQRLIVLRAQSLHRLKGVAKGGRGRGGVREYSRTWPSRFARTPTDSCADRFGTTCSNKIATTACLELPLIDPFSKVHAKPMARSTQARFRTQTHKGRKRRNDATATVE